MKHCDKIESVAGSSTLQPTDSDKEGYPMPIINNTTPRDKVNTEEIRLHKDLSQNPQITINWKYTPEPSPQLRQLMSLLLRPKGEGVPNDL